VELKNDVSIRGTLKSVDQFLNIKLDNISVVDEVKYPHLVSLTADFIPLDYGVREGRWSGK
jgi:small nuclear ribonucleoprotein (snRNP)-like protein